jgi:hypothetical protein
MLNPFKYVFNKIFGGHAHQAPLTNMQVYASSGNRGNFITLDNDINNLILANRDSRGSKDAGDMLMGLFWQQKSLWPSTTLKQFLCALIRDQRLTQGGQLVTENAKFSSNGNVENEVSDLIAQIQLGQVLILPRGL